MATDGLIIEIVLAVLHAVLQLPPLKETVFTMVPA